LRPGADLTVHVALQPGSANVKLDTLPVRLRATSDFLYFAWSALAGFESSPDPASDVFLWLDGISIFKTQAAPFPHPAESNGAFKLSGLVEGEYATPDYHGQFVFTDVSAGGYKLFSWAGIPEGAWTHADYLRKYEDRGLSVRLIEGERATALNVRVAPE
jgi:hypothetical protein